MTQHPAGSGDSENSNDFTCKQASKEKENWKEKEKDKMAENTKNREKELAECVQRRCCCNESNGITMDDVSHAKRIKNNGWLRPRVGTKSGLQAL